MLTSNSTELMRKGGVLENSWPTNLSNKLVSENLMDIAFLTAYKSVQSGSRAKDRSEVDETESSFCRQSHAAGIDCNKIWRATDFTCAERRERYEGAHH